LDVAFELKDIVFLRLAQERSPGMIIAIKVGVDNDIFYGVTWEDCSTTWHYGSELTHEFIPCYTE
jgi:hypothetical protein